MYSIYYNSINCQNIEYKFHTQKIVTNILILRTEDDEFFYNKLIQMLGTTYPIMTLDSAMSQDMRIIEYELCINKMLIQYVARNSVNQKNWFGKDK